MMVTLFKNTLLEGADDAATARAARATCTISGYLWAFWTHRLRPVYKSIRLCFPLNFLHLVSLRRVAFKGVPGTLLVVLRQALESLGTRVHVCDVRWLEFGLIIIEHD